MKLRTTVYHQRGIHVIRTLCRAIIHLAVLAETQQQCINHHLKNTPTSHSVHVEATHSIHTARRDTQNKVKNQQRSLA